MKLKFTEQAWEDYLYWQKTDKKLLRRINDLRYVFEYNGPTKEMNLRVVAAISMAANQLIGIDWSVTT